MQSLTRAARLRFQPAATRAATFALVGGAQLVAAQKLVPGEPLQIQLNGVQQTLEIVVPRDASGLRITTSNSDGDVELFVAHGRRPDIEDYDYDVASLNLWYEESLFIGVRDSYPLESGRWFIAVTDFDGDATTTTVTAEIVHPAEHTAIVGEVCTFELLREHGLHGRVQLELPKPPDGVKQGKSRWLVEVQCPSADVDVDVNPSGAFSGMEGNYGYGRGDFGYERFEIEVPPFRRRLTLEVFAYQELEPENRLPVRVLVQRCEPPEFVPALDLCPTPVLPDPNLPFALDPFDRAARATVLVVGPQGSGSGVMVSEDGYVLTCAHVLVGSEAPEKSGDGPVKTGASAKMARVSVGFSRDPMRSPSPTLGAEVIGLRQDLDLALLRITGDLLGRDIAARLDAERDDAAKGDAAQPNAGLKYPFVTPISRRLLLAEPVLGLGYPVTGGSANMVTLTITSGICAGYSREIEGVLMKTDAQVHSGDSGGPFLDSDGRLVGVAVSSQPDGELGGGIGYIVPCTLVPEEWRKLLGW